jgi:hypothetical protein
MLTARFADETKVTAFFEEDELRLRAVGTVDALNHVSAQLAWLGTAMQSSKYDGKCLGRTHLANLGCLARLQAYHLSFHHAPMNDTTPDVTQGGCWRKMFQDIVIAFGFPVRPRLSEREGIEVAFDTILALMGVQWVACSCGTFVIKGFSALLYASEVQGDTVFWHFVSNDDGSRISYTDQRISPCGDQVGTETLLERIRLGHFRHIIGWSIEVRNHVGMACSIVLHVCKY